jgi:uncharacterized protein
MATSSRRTSAPTPVAVAPDLQAPFLIQQPGEVFLIDVAVVPNARRTEVVGLHDQALRVRLAALPIDGAANEALQRWLADELGVAKQQVSLLRGASGRRKRLCVHATHQQMAVWLANLRDAGLLDC